MTTALSGRDAVLAALNSADLAVPPAPPDAGPPSLAWLRARAARFSEGAEHVRRRAHAVAALDAVGPDPLRERSRQLTATILAGASEAGRPEVDLMADVAYVVPVRVLAEALGIADPGGTVGTDVATIAPLYLAGPEPGQSTSAADEAVARLAVAAGGADEAAAATVALLVQSYAATAGLIGNACLAWLRERADGDAPAAVARTLRQDPPSIATRRLALCDTTIGEVHIGAGDVVWVDLASAGLTLGAGPHACPGAEQARAIAAGVLRAVQACQLIETEVEYVPARNVRVPVRLRVRIR